MYSSLIFDRFLVNPFLCIAEKKYLIKHSNCSAPAGTTIDARIRIFVVRDVSSRVSTLTTMATNTRLQQIVATAAPPKPRTVFLVKADINEENKTMLFMYGGGEIRRSYEGLYLLVKAI